MIKSEQLSTIEIKIISLIGNGLTAKEVSAQTGLKSRTIEKYLEIIREKLHANNTAHAVAFAISKKIITIHPEIENRP